MIPKIFIIKQKPNISKISAATLKELGFKSKAIAKNFAKLSDVNPKDFNTESALLTALKNQLNNFRTSVQYHPRVVILKPKNKNGEVGSYEFKDEILNT